MIKSMFFGVPSWDENHEYQAASSGLVRFQVRLYRPDLYIWDIYLIILKAVPFIEPTGSHKSFKSTVVQDFTTE